MQHVCNQIITALFILGLLSTSKTSIAREKKPNTILNYDQFKSYVDYFNRMEDENIVQAISNRESWDWMKQNVPLFECPQDNFEEIFIYRWWTLRKHIRETEAGYAFTEFLVERSYADNRGNEGKPMEKLNAFSSWTPYALVEKYKVDGDKEFMLNMLPDMIEGYKEWERMRRLDNGMFWQYDVRDGMEEQISGGRHVKNARPTINSYMAGNAMAIARMAKMAGDIGSKELYEAKADTLIGYIENQLWNHEMNFYETVKENGSYAGVREAIGYIPWYFNIPAIDRTVAWTPSPGISHTRLL